MIQDEKVMAAASTTLQEYFNDAISNLGLNDPELFNNVKNDFKVSFFDEPEYRVTTSKKTGRTIVSCTVHGMINLCKGNEELFNILSMFSSIVGEKERCEYSGFSVDYRYIKARYIKVTSKAVCHSDDEFDLEVGKKIARAKAENAAYRQALTKYVKLTSVAVNTAQRAQAALAIFASKTVGVIMHNVNYVHGLTSPNPDKLADAPSTEE